MVIDSESWEGSRPYSHGVPTFMPRQRVIRAFLRAAEVCATLVALFVVSQAVLPLLLHGSADIKHEAEPPALIERLLYWFIYAFTLLQWAFRPRHLLRALTRNPFVPALVGIAVLSLAWSVDPGVTVRRAWQLGMWTLFGLYLGARYSSRELLWLLGIVLGVSAVLSVVFGLMLPDYGVAHGVNEGAWQGVFTHKNTLGEAMLLAAIVFSLLAARRDGFRVFAWAGITLAIALMVLSRSMTALLVFGVLMVAARLARSLRPRRGKSVVLLLTVCCALSVALLLAATHRELVLSAVGRDVTFTGRTDLWAAVVDRIAQRPLLGYGYSAFWLHEAGPADVVRAAIGWDSPHSHNGFLDFWLDLGLVGLTVLATALALGVRRAWVRWSRDPDVEHLWPLAFLVATIFTNVTESPLYQGGLAWPLFVFAATATARWDDVRSHAVGMAL